MTKNTEKAVRRAAIAADNTVVTMTPVDTGRAKGNWITSIGEPVIQELDVEDKEGSIAMAQGAGVIAGWKVKMGPIYIANSLPYIEALDKGSSAKAPNGMTDFAIEAAKRQLKKVKLLKR